MCRLSVHGGAGMKITAASENTANAVIHSAHRLFDAGLVSETSGNVSARDPDGESMWITPSGMDCRQLTGRDAVRVHLRSDEVFGRWRPSSEWRLHVAAYRVRSDIGAIVHHHGIAASAVAVAQRMLPVVIDEAVALGPVPTARYAPSGSQELADAVATEIVAGRNAVLLANHGAVAAGRDLNEAFQRAREIERLARIYIDAEILGGAHLLDEVAIEQNSAFFAAYRMTSAACSELGSASPVGHSQVRMRDVANYAFQAGLTLVSLVRAAVLHR